MISKRTQIRLLVNGTPSENGWSAKQISNENEEDQKKNNLISLQINSPSDAIIGKYTVNFYKQKKNFHINIHLFIVIT
jgi:hypothetical protein